MKSRPEARRLSRAFAAMLEVAGVTIGQLDGAIAAQAKKGLPNLLRRGNDILDRLDAATGLTTVSVARRYRCFLVEAEASVEVPIMWIYREVSPAEAHFFCRADIPETAALALGRQPLSALVNAPYDIASAMIGCVAILPDGWVSATVSPEWIDVR